MTSLPPRPKPWENKGTSAAGPSTTTNAARGPSSSSAFDNALQASGTSVGAPKLPEKPVGLGDGVAGPSYANGLSTYQPQSRYGSSYMSPYGGMSGMSGMGSLGGMGGYGGYGGMNRFGGGGYGGYGYGMGGYGVGGMGGPGEGYPTLTSSLQASTAPAFAVVESLVTAFTSLAQLVESTYMATHSSFFAMVGVADQLGSLKTYLGQVLGVFSLLRLGKRIIAWLKGKRGAGAVGGASLGAGAGMGWANEWSGVGSVGGAGAGVGGVGDGGRPSAKPLILFLLSAVGLPWLMARLVKLLIATQQQQQQLNGTLAGGEALNGGPIDPAKLQFARSKWEFKAAEEWELSLSRDEIIAVLEKRDPASAGAGAGHTSAAGSASGVDGTGDGERGWWRGRTRDGRIGWFPGNYVSPLRRSLLPHHQISLRSSAVLVQFSSSMDKDEGWMATADASALRRSRSYGGGILLKLKHSNDRLYLAGVAGMINVNILVIA